MLVKAADAAATSDTRPRVNGILAAEFEPFNIPGGNSRDRETSHGSKESDNVSVAASSSSIGVIGITAIRPSI
jgi:hypothetical protein